MPSEDRGICSTCNSTSACCLRATNDCPVFYCEEFDNYVPVRVFRAQTREWKVEQIPKKHNGYAGLCIDCVNRDECAFPKSEDGIWHCEEYR
ncbi:MAG: hypothetical protein ABIH23_17270 [bacterium]